MAKMTIDVWESSFPNTSGIFNSINTVSLPFTKLVQWPTLQQLSSELTKRDIFSCNGSRIRSVEQEGPPEKFDDHYESRIFLKGELQTRLENWHDFFNAMCWLQFPKIKAALNMLHFESSKTRKAGTNRTPLENAITLFDECGAIIVSNDEGILDSIRCHQWSDVFLDKDSWDNQGASGKHVRCYVFGHAMHEKALTPYIGMTTHSILLKQKDEFFQQDYSAQLNEIDQIIADVWLNNNPSHKIVNTKNLHPFPLLGVPGWWNGNQDVDFYSNEEYFRPKKI